MLSWLALRVCIRALIEREERRRRGGGGGKAELLEENTLATESPLICSRLVFAEYVWNTLIVCFGSIVFIHPFKAPLFVLFVICNILPLMVSCFSPSVICVSCLHRNVVIKCAFIIYNQHCLKMSSRQYGATQGAGLCIHTTFNTRARGHPLPIYGDSHWDTIWLHGMSQCEVMLCPLCGRQGL